MSLVHAFEHFKHLECLALELGGCRLGPETQNDRCPRAGSLSACDTLDHTRPPSRQFWEILFLEDAGSSLGCSVASRLV